MNKRTAFIKAWYDNESSYTAQLVRTILYVGQLI
jgi:glyceraldehyde-3-phosphate dehydrogenase/erythrose-4-phosphate dehydrogenase